MATDKQATLVVLSTDQDNKYPTYLKLKEIERDAYENIEPFFNEFVRMSKERVLNTDGKTTYSKLASKINLHREKIDYSDNNHRLWFLNKIVSNLNSSILGVFHGIDKRMMPLYFSKFEWRYNNKHSKDFLCKISNYIRSSYITTRKMITNSMDLYAQERDLA